VSVALGRWGKGARSPRPPGRTRLGLGLAVAGVVLLFLIPITSGDHVGAGPTSGLLPVGGSDTLKASAIPREPSTEGSRRSASPPNVVLTGTTVLNMSHDWTIGNLTVENSATLEFGNASWSATLTIEGNILLLDHARVHVWDAYVVVDGTYNDERSAGLYDNATLVLDDALVTSGDFAWGAELYGSSNLTLVSSSLGTWCVFSLHNTSTAFALSSEVDGDAQPEGASHVTMIDSAGVHLWLEFAYGTEGNFSVPAAGGSTNWTFPAPGTTRGVDAGIRLVDTEVGLYAVSLDDGANVTLSNSTNLDLALIFYDDTVDVSGLHEGENANFTFPSATIGLRLVNVTVLSWSLYPVASTVTIADSEVGELIGWLNTSLNVLSSNLTGTGGVYGAFDAAQLSITNCTVWGEVVGWNASTVRVTNSSIRDPGPQSVLAVDSARVVLTNVAASSGVGYDAQGEGNILVLSPLAVVAEVNGAAAPGALVDAEWAANGSMAAPPVSAANGTVVLELPTENVTAAGAAPSGVYLVQVVDGTDVGETSGSLVGLATWTVELEPYVVATTPANGTADVPLGSGVTWLFALPMQVVPSGPDVQVTPSAPVALSWSDGDRVLKVAPTANWAPSTTYDVSILPPAETADGLGIPVGFSVSFSTAAGLPAVAVSGSSPANGSTGVFLNAVVVVNFTVPMDPASTLAAFSIVPTPALGIPALEGDELRWSPNGLLSPATTYTVTIGATAGGVDGQVLGAPVVFAFTTVPLAAVPRVVSWTPGNGSSAPGPVAEVTLAWNVPMNAASIASAFEVVPALPGTLSESGNETIWTPSTALPNGTEVLVEVGASASSDVGEVAAAAMWSTFEVVAGAAPPVTSPSASSGPSLPDVTAVLLVVLALLLGVVAGVFLGRRTPPSSSLPRGAPPDTPPLASATPSWSEGNPPADPPAAE
jgi:hypothetical protein